MRPSVVSFVFILLINLAFSVLKKEEGIVEKLSLPVKPAVRAEAKTERCMAPRLRLCSRVLVYGMAVLTFAVLLFPASCIFW